MKHAIIIGIGLFCSVAIITASELGSVLEIKDSGVVPSSIKRQVTLWDAGGSRYIYEPSVNPESLLHEVNLSGLSLASDGSFFVTVESAKMAGGRYFNRLVWVDNEKFRLIKFIEFESAGKIINLAVLPDGGAAWLEIETEIDHQYHYEWQIIDFATSKIQKIADIPSGKVFSIQLFNRQLWVTFEESSQLAVLNLDSLKLETAELKNPRGFLVPVRKNSIYVLENGICEKFILQDNSFFRVGFTALELKTPIDFALDLRNDGLTFLIGSAGKTLLYMTDSGRLLDLNLRNGGFAVKSAEGVLMLMGHKKMLHIYGIDDFENPLAKIDYGTMKPRSSGEVKFLSLIFNDPKEYFTIITNRGEFLRITKDKRRYVKEILK